MADRINIYDSNYNPSQNEDGFGSVEEAIEFIGDYLASEDNVYLLGNGREIVAIVFQGRAYYPNGKQGQGEL